MTRHLPTILLLSACSGSEVQFSSLRPELAVLPEALDFGEVVAGEETPSLDVFVDNAGLAELIADLSVDGADAGAFTVDQTHLEIAPDGQVTVPVTFAPTELRPYAANLVVSSNDPEQALWVVPLAGIGRVPYAPEIEIRPATGIDFGSVAVGVEDLGFFEIANTGDADLVLGSIVQSGAGTFQLQTDPSGSIVAPGQSRAVVVRYTPVQPAGDSGEVRIPSNDADEPLVTVALQANGGGQFDYPEAVIACPGQVDLAGPILVHLDGSASTDPLAGPLTYWWEVVRRPTAADPDRQPDPRDQPETDLWVDAAGTWEVTLQVTSDLGVPSVPEKCVIEAVPVDELHVELSWGGATSDLDLHLADGEAAFFDVPGDVSWCNRNPDWGGAGDEDDPRLDVDDDDGFGPENINLASPADGTYVVRVHHFDDGDDGSVTANVQVFTYGTLAWSGSKVLARNDVWEVGQVNWPDGTFGLSDLAPWDALGLRECAP